MTSRLSRRSMLGGGVRAAGLALTPAGTARATDDTAAVAAPPALVLVRLRGGADGASLLVPHEDDDYRRARPSTAIAYSRQQRRDLQLERGFALHPRLAALKPWFDDGELGGILGVGLPQLPRSHQEAWKQLDDAILRSTPRQVLTLDLGGWDSHVAQGANEGRHADACAALAAELQALKLELGPALSRVLVVVLTEFGRSLVETPLRGTDDGHASIMLVLGGGRSWGRLLGAPPRLQPSALHAQRLPVPTANILDVLARLARGEAPL